MPPFALACVAASCAPLRVGWPSAAAPPERGRVTPSLRVFAPTPPDGAPAWVHAPTATRAAIANAPNRVNRIQTPPVWSPRAVRGNLGRSPPDDVRARFPATSRCPGPASAHPAISSEPVGTEQMTVLTEGGAGTVPGRRAGGRRSDAVSYAPAHRLQHGAARPGMA